MSRSPGTRLGSYEVTALIGQGGMGGSVAGPPYPAEVRRRSEARSPGDSIGVLE